MSINLEKMKGLNTILGDNRELHILKGQLLSPTIIAKRDGTGHYMGFKLKVIKKQSEDEYMQVNNIYWIIVPEQTCKALGSAYFRELTGHEVIVLVEINNRVKGANIKEPVYLNYVSYFLVDIMKTRDVKKDDIVDF